MCRPSYRLTDARLQLEPIIMDALLDFSSVDIGLRSIEKRMRLKSCEANV